MVGLGNIAQKAYLPILSKETNWEFVGAFTPNIEKRKMICNQYRIEDFSSVTAVADACDAVFVHSSTATHFDVISSLLSNGKHVYVDKPLAATLDQAEKLVELQHKTSCKLMVGFNRRFAPMYIKAKEQSKDLAWARFEKHRANSVGPHDVEFTMLDDYLHLVDTIRWLADGELFVQNGAIRTSEKNEMVFAQHTFSNTNGLQMTTAMHRNAGTGLEQLELVTDGAIIRVKNMNMTEVEASDSISTSYPASWDSTLKQRGFEDAIYHFIHCVANDITPLVDGEEALKSQKLLMQLINPHF
ncbi:Gfo/Idh/MocA family protein [Robertmurraya korlensis]|uniref:Gfo/Idh/MocA family protein n=1 Tax=Robertmurraya korlensis TaxID=519977 RepID=UPI003F75EED9